MDEIYLTDDEAKEKIIEFIEICSIQDICRILDIIYKDYQEIAPLMANYWPKTILIK